MPNSPRPVGGDAGARWETAPAHPAVATLAKTLAVDPLVAQVLLTRGYATPDRARSFLDAPLESLSDPGQIIDLGVAAERVRDAVVSGEPITIYGDYDADGITATSILLRGLKAVGGAASFYIPSRFTEGYGLNDAALQRLAASGQRLIVTVDCGVTAIAEISHAVDRGQEVVVVDHHEPPLVLPPALAVVDPKRHDAAGPFAEYSAAGLAFQLMRAVRRLLHQPEFPEDLLDLAALGTIADVVPLVADNRILARWGLQRMQTSPTAGIAALRQVGGLSGEATARQVSFTLAPRINAAGRLGDATVGVRLLTTDDPEEAQGIAAQLDAMNQHRRELTDQILAQAVERMESADRPPAPAIVLADEGWHPGVIGIVASQLVERYYRPTIVLAVEQGVGKGSARSIARFHLVDALAECADLLERYGGHAMAAGLTIRAERIPEFTRRFEEVASAHLTPDDLVPTLPIDSEIALSTVTLPMAEQLQRLAPFGAGNPEPIFAARDLVAVTTRVMSDGAHLRLGVTDGDAFAEAVGFRLGDASELLAFTRARIDLAFTVVVDRWEDRPRLQLIVQDLKTPGVELADVLTDGRVLVDRLFARSADYLDEEPLGLEDAGAFYTKVAGVTFEGRQDIVKALRAGDTLALRREPDNPHDPHAVKVLTESGGQIGYLSGRVASRLAPSMDTGARYTANVSQITGGGERSFGVNLYVRRENGLPREDVDPSRTLRMGWTSLPLDEITARVCVHLCRGRMLRDIQGTAVRALLGGRSVKGVFGPGRGRRTVMEVAAAVWVIAGRGPVVLCAPLQSQVDRWYERLAGRLQEIGLRCARAHGGLRFRQRQILVEGMQTGSLDVLVASVEYLRQWRLSGPWRPSLILLDSEPTIDGNTFAAVVRTLGDPLWGWFSSRPPEPAVALPHLEATEGVSDPFLRTNLRLVDRREVGDRDALISAVCVRGDKTLLFTGARAPAVELASRLREAGNERAAYYHGGLPLRVREVLEQLFADGKIPILVAADGFAADAAPGDVRQVVVAGLPTTRADLAEIIGSAGLDGRQATVTLAYRRDDLHAAEGVLVERHPTREMLASLYRVLRSEAERSGAVVWPDETLAAALRSAGLPPKVVGLGLDILAEAGVIQREFDGDHWRITLGGPDRKDLTTSVRFAEGRREAEALAALEAFAFGPLTEILQAVASPGAVH